MKPCSVNNTFLILILILIILVVKEAAFTYAIFEIFEFSTKALHKNVFSSNFCQGCLF